MIKRNSKGQFINGSMPKPNTGQFKKGNHPKTEFRKGKMSDSNHPRWQGNSISMDGVHQWVKRQKGKASYCKHCGKTKGKFHWANKRHTYKRKLNDYIPLCPSCHTFYDLKNNLKPDNKIGTNQFKQHTYKH